MSETGTRPTCVLPVEWMYCRARRVSLTMRLVTGREKCYPGWEFWRETTVGPQGSLTMWRWSPKWTECIRSHEDAPGRLFFWAAEMAWMKLRWVSLGLLVRRRARSLENLSVKVSIATYLLREALRSGECQSQRSAGTGERTL